MKKQKQLTQVTEALAADEMKAIRLAIRKEVARIFFDLYRKKGTWTAV